MLCLSKSSNTSSLIKIFAQTEFEFEKLLETVEIRKSSAISSSLADESFLEKFHFVYQIDCYQIKMLITP